MWDFGEAGQVELTQLGGFSLTSFFSPACHLKGRHGSWPRLEPQHLSWATDSLHDGNHYITGTERQTLGKLHGGQSRVSTDCLPPEFFYMRKKEIFYLCHDYFAFSAICSQM